MEYIPKTDSKRYENSSSCTALEYDFENESDINSAVIELEGRYPDNGFAINDVCKEIIYIIEGRGYVMNGTRRIDVEQGGMVRIIPGNKYFFDGSMRLLIASSPAWYPAQYHTVA